MGTVRVGIGNAAVGHGDATGQGEATGHGEIRGDGAAGGAVERAADPGPMNGVADADPAPPVDVAPGVPVDIASGVRVAIGPSGTVPPPRQPATKPTVAAAVARPARRRRGGKRSILSDSEPQEGRETTVLRPVGRVMAAR